MLTGDLLNVRVKGATIAPRFLDVNDSGALSRAATVRALVAEAAEGKHSRLEVDAAVGSLVGLAVDHKLLRGLAKVALDACTFAPSSPPPEMTLTPMELRDQLFQIAARAREMGMGTFDSISRGKVIEEMGTKLGVSGPTIMAHLFSDLKDMHRLLESKQFPSDEALLHRYNLSLCQSLLLRSSALRVELHHPDAKWVRMLFRFIKFHRLMHHLDQKGDSLVLVMDGPQSLLRLSTRYGMQLALFLPALLLLPTPWTFTADVHWGVRRKAKKKLLLDSNMNLKSHYTPKGVWRSNAEIWFEERWKSKERSWKMRTGSPISLPGGEIVCPDFTFEQNGQVVHMEIIGFWRKGQLRKRLDNLPPNLMLAVSRNMCGDKGVVPKTLLNRVIPFAEIIAPREVEARLDGFL